MGRVDRGGAVAKQGLTRNERSSPAFEAKTGVLGRVAEYASMTKVLRPVHVIPGFRLLRKFTPANMRS